MPDEGYSGGFEVEVVEVSKDLLDEIFGEFFESAESVASIPLRHQKVDVGSRQTQVQIRLHQTQISLVALEDGGGVRIG